MTTKSLDIVSYENRLSGDSRWALAEGSRHFERRSAVFEALRKITRRLGELNVPYAVVGGMALFHHGLRRFTEDVDILVGKEDLERIHDELEGLGYLPPHRLSKHLRDTELGVRIEFLTTGEYPGDGKVKPVAFPDPALVSFESDGVKYINLASLVELKLASGMTSPGRLRDLSDVLELIKILELPLEFSEQLNAYVRDKYRDLWTQAQTRYVTLWSVPSITVRPRTIGELIASLGDAAGALRDMEQDGVVLVDDERTGAHGALLATTDSQVAKKYDMIEESEFWGLR